jgi:iron complex transport system substrate-binding protein
MRIGSRRTAGWRALLLLWVLACAPAAAEEAPRVISMAPHLTELAFAAGADDRLVGVVDYSDFPPRAAELPSIGDAFRFDLERIMALEPDLALAWEGGTPTRSVDRLRALGIEVLRVETRSLDDIADALALIGRRLGRAEVGEAAARNFRQGLSAREAPVEQPSLRVFYQVSPRPLYTLGGRHVINEVFERCGLVNVFAGLDTEAAVVDFEAVLAAEPDWIIAGRGNDGRDALAQWRESGLLDQERTRLHQVEPELLVRPTPRILEGIDHLCRLRESGG